MHVLCKCTDQTFYEMSSQKESGSRQNTATSRLAYPLLRCNPFWQRKTWQEWDIFWPAINFFVSSRFHIWLWKGNSNDFDCPRSKYLPTDEMIEDHSKSESVNASDKCFKGLPEEQGVDAWMWTQKPFSIESKIIPFTSENTWGDCTATAWVTPIYLTPSLFVTTFNADPSLQHNSTSKMGRLFNTARTSRQASSSAIYVTTASDKSGIDRSSKPRVSRCLKNNCELRHFVKRSDTFSEPARCFIRTTPFSIWDRIHKSLISMWRDFFGISTPWINWSADAESDSSKTFTTVSGAVSPIPSNKRSKTFDTETASWAACWIEYNSLSQLLMDVACCCLATALTKLFSKNITCPLMPFRLLNLYGACDASAHKWT